MVPELVALSRLTGRPSRLVEGQKGQGQDKH